MPVHDFTSDPVVRGRLTNARTGVSLGFLFNPTSIKDAGGAANIAEDAIPGFSDTLVRWLSGKSKPISFVIRLDGTESLRLRGGNLGNAAQRGRPDEAESFSIAGEIAFFESFAFPVDPDLPGATGGADNVIFSFGSRYRRVLCAMEVGEIEITDFTPQLDPHRATIPIVLRRIVHEQRWAHDVWASPYDGDR